MIFTKENTPTTTPSTAIIDPPPTGVSENINPLIGVSTISLVTLVGVAIISRKKEEE